MLKKRLTTKAARGISPQRRGERGDGTKEEATGTADCADYADSGKRKEDEKEKEEAVLATDAHSAA